MNREVAIREALSDLEAQRAENRLEEKRRREEAAGRSPAIAALLERRQNLFFSGVRSAFSQPDMAQDISSQMSGELLRINERLRGELDACGLPRDYLQPVYRCGVCRDTGYVGEPVHEMCACLRRAVLERLYRDEGLQGLESENFAAYDASVFSAEPLPGLKEGQRAHMEKIRALCERYADAFDPASGEGLLLTGKPGLGKTFLMNCVAQRVLERGFSVVVVSAYRLVEIMRASLFGEGSGERADELLGCDLLCVDDLGSEPMLRNVTVSALYHVLSERHNARRAVVVTSNCLAREIEERYDARVAARLCDGRRMKAVLFVGEDVRRR